VYTVQRDPKIAENLSDIMNNFKQSSRMVQFLAIFEDRASVLLGVQASFPCSPRLGMEAGVPKLTGMNSPGPASYPACGLVAVCAVLNAC
jgi:hypothetical protein